MDTDPIPVTGPNPVDAVRIAPERWPVARFPSASARARFFERLRLWSRVEGAPRVDVFPLGDGRAIRYRRCERADGPMAALIHAFGGHLHG